MWKVITLSTFLSVCQSANINDFYGTYTSVMLYPQMSEPVCNKIVLAEDSSHVQCTCSDGYNCTLIEITNKEHLSLSHQLQSIKDPAPESWPMLAVDKVDDQMLLTNFTCDCAGKEFDHRFIVKSVNENYILSYILDGPRGGHVRKLNYFLARSLPSAAELEADIKLIDEVKDKTGSVMCNRELYEEFRSKN